MDGIQSSRSAPTPPNDRNALRRVAAAVAVSTLLHLAIALWMRPSARPVSDFAVDFEIAYTAPLPPKAPAPAPEPEPESEPVKPPEPEKPKEAPKKKSPAAVSAAVPPKTVKVDTDTDTDEPRVAVSGGDTDTGEGGGICLHDLYPYVPEKPRWLLYVAAAAFRDSLYEKELGNTFNSFELGRRLAEMTGLNLTGEVEALSVAAENIFDWRTFQIAASYDFGEEALMARIKNRRKETPDFAWHPTPDGFEAAIPGQFRWEMVSSGRVMHISHEPEPKKVLPPLPDNPFEISTDPPNGANGSYTDPTDPLSRAIGSDTDQPNADPPGGTIGSADADTGADGSTGKTARKWPSQIECLSQTEPAPKSQRKTSGEALTAAAREMTVPNAEGHWPVAVLTTSDPRAVGLGTRMGRKLGFEIAAVRGYFTEPVRLEGYLRFSKDPDAVAALAEDWKQDAVRYAADPFLAVAGVSALLKNIKIEAEGNTLRFSLEMKHGQVLSTLMFLQLQGRALERQLKSD